VNLLDSLDLLNQVAGQLCWLTPANPPPQWTSLNSTLFFPSADISAVTIGTSIYVVGGGETRPGIQIYDTATGEWMSINTTIARKSPAVAMDPSGSNIFIFGGIGTNGIGLDTYDILNLATGVITTRSANPANLLSSHAQGSFAVVGNVIYFFGGFGGTTIDPTVAAYDLELQDFVQWSSSPTMYPARYGSSAVALGSSIYVIGGAVDLGFTNLVQVFDTVTNTFQNRSQYGYAMDHMAAVSSQGLLFLTGGRLQNINSNFLASFSVMTMNPRTNQWSNVLLPNLINGREGHAMALVGNTIYVIGGRIANGNPYVLQNTPLIETVVPCF